MTVPLVFLSANFIYRVRYFGRIRKRICFLRSFGSCCIKGTDESLSRVDSSVPLMQHDPNDLRSQIRSRILPQKTNPFVLSSLQSNNVTCDYISGLLYCTDTVFAVNDCATPFVWRSFEMEMMLKFFC